MLKTFEVAPEEFGNRLDILIHNHSPEFSRSAIQKAIRNGLCFADDNPILAPDFKPAPGQIISFELVEAITDLIEEEKPINIIWQDENIIALNKPPHLTVHPAPSCMENTLVNRLIFHFPALKKLGGLRPGIIHRLDKDTSGLILIAKNENIRLKMCELFALHQIKKIYLALVHGRISEEGICDLPIGRHPIIKTKMSILPENQGGKQALTKWVRLFYFAEQNVSLAAIRIFTGRTHQIRVHLQSLGHPVIGDNIYAPKQIASMASRQMLHAWQTSFVNPVTSQCIKICAEPPGDFIMAVNSLFDNKQEVKIKDFQMSVPLLLVVTGNPGCGKSFFCKQFEKIVKKNNIYISADEIVAKIYQSSEKFLSWVYKNFGDKFINKNNNGQKIINKKKLFEAFVNDTQIRQEFQNHIFAIVYEEIRKFNQAKNDEPILIAEIPLYFESDHKDLNEIKDRTIITIGINAGQKIRWSRLKNNRNWDDSKIKEIESWQWPENKKIAACDYVVNNNGDTEDLDEQIELFVKNVITNYMTKESFKKLSDPLVEIISKNQTLINKLNSENT